MMDSSAAARLRRSEGQVVVARGLWYVKPGTAELRSERLDLPRPGEARVRTEFSAFSRGTERHVAFGNVPKSEISRMRAPLQAGEFPFPVKYGYSAAGVVTAGKDEMIGRRVFCLAPHQDHFHAPEAMLADIPAGVPSKRATLAANMETALNAHWDAGTSAADRVLVVGAGIVGLLTAYIARRIAGTDVVVTDIDAGRAAIAGELGLAFCPLSTIPHDRRLVFHTSGTAAGLQSAIEAAAFEGRVIEMSWYANTPVTLALGGPFHAQRLTIIASQVGHVAPSRRPLITPRERLQGAVALLDDPALDALVAQEIPFSAVANAIPGLLTEQSSLPPVIRYSD